MYPDGRNELLCVGFNSDVLTCWQMCYERFKEQPGQIGLLDEIRYVGTIDDKCQAVFGYMCNNVSYRLDDDGYQYIKSPKRLLSDKCGDCKSLTMFVACCLHCLGIKCIVRFVNFDGSNQYTHVYPVAVDEYGREIIMDMCETDAGIETNGTPLYNYARPYKRKKDFIYG